jgi:hypothetical protein
MTGKVDIGLFVTSHNIGEVSAVALDHVTITPGPDAADPRVSPATVGPRT